MIKKNEHKRLMKVWESVGPGIYQTWNRLETRMPLFLKHINILREKNVLEFGCNAGIYGYEISKIAKYYIGIDQGKYYILQANETKKLMNMNNALFLNRPAKGFIRDQQKAELRNIPTHDINAIFATFVLYHLSDKETDLIEEYLLPKCDAALIMTRTSKRSPWKKYNSNHFEVPENCATWLEKAGFITSIEWHHTKKFAIITGEKKDDNNKRESGRNKKSTRITTERRRSSSINKNGVSQGGTMLHAKREIDAERTNGVLSSVQTGVGAEGILQGGQRGELSSDVESGKKRMEQKKKTDAVQGNSGIPQDSKSPPEFGISV